MPNLPGFMPRMWRSARGGTLHPRLVRQPGARVVDGTRRDVIVTSDPCTVVASFGSGPLALVLAEQPARVRETKWNLGGLCSDRVLSFPNLLFAGRFHRGVFESAYAFFLKEPYAGLDSRLYHTILPNATDSGWICMGNAMTRDALVRSTAALTGWREKLEVLIEHFWTSCFTDHLIERLTDRGPQLHPHLTSLASWEEASRRNPDFVHDVAWVPAFTAGDFVQHRIGGRR